MPHNSPARPIRVIFLVFYCEAWDSLDETYRRMLADDRFEPLVITIPRKLTGYDDFTDEPLVSAFFTERGIAHERFSFVDSGIGLARLRELDPDYLFLNYPWQRNYQPGYQIEELIRFTRVCYVPYFSSSLVQEPAHEGIAPHQYTQPTHQLAHLIFLQDAEVKSAFDEADYGNHAYRTGSPKIDALIASAETTTPHWPLNHVLDPGNRPLHLLWAPHHSYGQNWLNFGVFTDMCHDMLDFARRNPHIDVVLRPHPFLFGTLTDRDLMTSEELAAWQHAWDALPNTAVDGGTPFPEVFLATDVLLTDGISFLVEYPLVTGRPAIFWEKPQHWAFTATGALAAEASVRVKNMAEFEALMATVTAAVPAPVPTRGPTSGAATGSATGSAAVQVDALPDRSAPIAALLHYVSPHPGQAAARIIKRVLKDFAKP